MKRISEYGILDLFEGQSFSYNLNISEKMVDSFAELTGDISPLHVDKDFAFKRGFKDRVVHGAMLCGFISRFVGVHLPGRNSLIHSINIKYLRPTYVNEVITITGEIDQISLSVKTIVIKILIVSSKSQSTLAKCKLTVGLTD
jgi:3-hydroxybutyryl-CoA dehydratase